MTYHVDRITLEPQLAAVVSGSVAHDGIAAFLGEAFAQVAAALQEQGSAPAGPPFARYAMSGDGWEIDAGFPVVAEINATGNVHPITLPGGTGLVVLHQGPYQEVAGAYRAAEQWMAENSWSPAGTPWEVYLDEPDVEQPRTIVHVPGRPV